ncbi:hypothetical protein [Sphingomonas sp. 3-13AW]|uniref:hypothetical protein n=1 Tax=Sphingomonas sp. 3-13AW TaxID=3050450 RepID=UPI003BB767E8
MALWVVEPAGVIYQPSKLLERRRNKPGIIVATDGVATNKIELFKQLTRIIER